MYFRNSVILPIFFLLIISANVKAQDIYKLKKKLEIKKLKSDNYPTSEIFLGLNLNTNFGTIKSTENTLNLESVSLELDNYIPSFNLGFKYLLNPKKHHGLFIQVNHYSKKALKFNDNTSFNPAFENSFNEIKVGVVYGRLQLGYGKILEQQIIQKNETVKYSLNSLNLSYTIFRSNRLKNPRTIKDYWSVNTGFNYVSDFDDLNYINFSLGFKYHFTFNRKLDLKDKIWIQKRTFE